MDGEIIECGEGFWNIRGRFRIGGILDIGTQASLVRLSDGSFVMLDSYALPPETLRQLDRLTGGREAVARVINTHPFHTLHAPAMHRDFPSARHHGTARHRRLHPGLAWDPLASEDPALWQALAPDLAFSVPDGVAFISANEAVHFAAILVFHPASGSLHVDDTFNCRPLGLGRKGRLALHPTLRQALEPRPGAAAAFRAWGAGLVAGWASARTVCTAHNGLLRAADLDGARSVAGAMAEALARGEPTLARHEARWG